MTAPKTKKPVKKRAAAAPDAARTEPRIEQAPVAPADAASEAKAALPASPILHPKVFDPAPPLPGWVKRALYVTVLILAALMAIQIAVNTSKYFGRAFSLYRQFRQFREFVIDGDDFTPPVPIPDGDFSGLKKYIRKNFPRTIPASQRDAAAQIFAEAADRVDDGTLVNRDDLLGFLGENLKPVCRAPAWIPFLTGVWSELRLDAGASPETLSGTCRAVAGALSEVAMVLVSGVLGEDDATDAIAEEPAEPKTEPAPEPEPSAEEIPAEEPAPAEQTRDCKSGNCPAASNAPGWYYPYYGGSF